MESSSDKQTVRLLLVTDVHNAVSQCVKVAAFAQGHTAVLVTGDLSNYNHGRSDSISESEAEQQLQAVLRALETGHETPLFFIPGNHDAPSLFQPDAPRVAGTRSVALHATAPVQLADGLVIMGLGGSVPATQDGYQAWEGFPYTEQQFGNSLNDLWSKSAQAIADKQVILATHIGPADVSTSAGTRDPSRIVEAGSTNLKRLFLQNDAQNSIVLNVHGHVHDHGLARLGKITIANAGALTEKRYGSVTLSKKPGEKWIVESVSFFKLE